jgi:hypothetical protein
MIARREDLGQSHARLIAVREYAETWERSERSMFGLTNRLLRYCPTILRWEGRVDVHSMLAEK